MKLNKIKIITFSIIFIMILSTIVVAKYRNIKKPADNSSKSPTNTAVEQPTQKPEVNIPEPNKKDEPIEEHPEEKPMEKGPVEEAPVEKEPVPEIKENPIIVESADDENDDNDDSNMEKTESSSENKNIDREKIIKSSYISEEKAIEIALKKMGKKAELKEIKNDFDNNPPIYKLIIEKNKFIYELEIHAKTGAILDSQKTKVK